MVKRFTNTRERTNDVWLRLLPWIAGAFAGLSGSWTANLLDRWMRTGEVDAPLDIIQVVVFGSSVAGLFLLRNTTFRPRTRYLKSETPAPHGHVVLFLSRLDNDKVNDHGLPFGLNWKGSLSDVLLQIALWKTTENPAYGDRKPPYWPWEMPLRGIIHHNTSGRLKSVTLICSDQSLPDAKRFCNLFKPYSQFRNVVWQCFVRTTGRRGRLITIDNINDQTQGWDFEGFDEMTSGFRDLFTELRKQGCAETDIVVDFTGGTKVASVVAATATFDLGVRAQYVQTREPWNVLSYDLVVDRSETDGL